MKSLTTSVIGFALVALLAPLGASAQVSPAQARQLAEQNPDLVRERLLQSGLSEQQIRDRIRSAGLPPGRIVAACGSGLVQGDQRSRRCTRR